jgi:stearoyl-CoA desaturase (delta-9 desaturase)
VWASLHRDHHRYVDTDTDPYSIKKGFWHAHIGWIFFWKHESTFENSKDLLKNKMLMHQHNNYLLWASGAGIILPVVIGAMMGHALGAFVFAVCARLTLVYQSTFCINSICHMVGTATYDPHSSAKDHWFVALLTNGEGYHNFHHRFPTDYRNGVRWYHWDPSKWMIALLSKMGLAWQLQKVSEFAIIEARLAGEKQRMHDELVQIQNEPHHHTMKEALQLQHENLVKHLKEWEASVKSYQAHISHEARVRMQKAQADYLHARSQWNAHSRTWLMQLRPQPAISS